MIFPVVAHAAPVIEAVESGDAGNPVLQRSATRKTGLFLGTDAHAIPLSIGLALPLPDRDGSGVGAGIDVEAVVAALQDCERLVGRVDFVSLSTEQVADVQIQRALIKFDLDNVVARIRQGETRLSVHAQGGTPEVQLGA